MTFDRRAFLAASSSALMLGKNPPHSIQALLF